MSTDILQPTLEDDLILLRPLQEKDIPFLFELAADPLIWEQHPEPDRYKPEVFQKYIDSALESKGALVVIEKATGNIIGCSRYYEFDPEEKTVAIGFTFLRRSHWGGKYNHAMKKLMIDHAFRFVNTICFHIGENNLRSQAAIKKIGAIYSGRKSKEVLVFSVSRLPDGSKGESMNYLTT